MKPVFLILLTTLLAFGCKKDKVPKCYTEEGIGRIIGYNPCGHYKDPNKVYGTGFVLEIGKGASKDTVATYQIPDGIFEFPEIDYWAAVNGAFLFPKELQNRYQINFTYKIASENEKTAYVCPANVNLGPYYGAVKDRQVLVSCITK